MSARQSPPPLPETWLDALPDEICDEIARQLNCGRPTQDALNLAVISRKQTLAAARSLSHPVLINVGRNQRFEPLLSDESLARWASVFAEYPLSVMMYNVTPFAVRLFQQANLEEAHLLKASNDVLATLSSSRSLRFLHISLTPSTNVDRVIEVLSSLRLEVLTVAEELALGEELDAGEEEHLFEDLIPFAKASVRCIEACGPSTRIFWDDANDIGDDSRSYWDAVALLPDHTRISITTQPPENMITKVSQFRAVKLEGVPTRIAGLLGSAVLQYCNYIVDSTVNMTAEADEVMELGHCPRMNELKLSLGANAQEAMVEIAPRLHCLESLGLYWRNSCDGWSRHEVKLTPGVMLNIVRASPKLADLELLNGDVPISEWEQILVQTGDHLQSLHMSKEGSKARVCAFLLRMFSFMTRYSKNLKSFWISIISNTPVSTYHDATNEQVSKVVHAARRLQMANPSLNNGRFEGTISRLLSITPVFDGTQVEE